MLSALSGAARAAGTTELAFVDGGLVALNRNPLWRISIADGTAADLGGNWGGTTAVASLP